MIGGGRGNEIAVETSVFTVKLLQGGMGTGFSLGTPVEVGDRGVEEPAAPVTGDLGFAGLLDAWDRGDECGARPGPFRSSSPFPKRDREVGLLGVVLGSY